VATLVSAAAIAAEIILISHFASKVDSTRVTVVQVLAGGLYSFAAMPLAGEAAPAFSWVWLASAVGLGAASALIQLTMNWAQKTVSPTRATIIYASEPVWGGVVGRLAGDRMPVLALVGAAFIVAGVVVSELKPRWKEAPAPI
jgi:drug/metabolite transporter (DMT)-like permease